MQTLLSEISVSQQDFLAACKKAKQSGNKRQWKIVRQILLVDNFDEFRNLMVKRNKELERKALELMLKEEKRRLAGP